MNTATHELLAASSPMLHSTLVLIGIVVAGSLVWAVKMGVRVMENEPPRPLAEEHGMLPATGAVHEVFERREPDEIPLAAEGSPRLRPYQLHHSGSRRSEDQTRRRWSPGSSGAFGSGGPGRV
ncbi:DUF6479 family protein [Streptomyces sp. NPDC096538]|uniref:DUF6479 family protein n=1 Tax=Streptomyces sp. NPDC096538 TaxID=3155427 RepID=UPI0033222275